jgi:hypothetical protein
MPHILDDDGVVLLILLELRLLDGEVGYLRRGEVTYGVDHLRVLGELLRLLVEVLDEDLLVVGGFGEAETNFLVQLLRLVVYVREFL